MQRRQLQLLNGNELSDCLFWGEWNQQLCKAMRSFTKDLTQMTEWDTQWLAMEMKQKMSRKEKCRVRKRTYYNRWLGTGKADWKRSELWRSKGKIRRNTEAVTVMQTELRGNEFTKTIKERRVVGVAAIREGWGLSKYGRKGWVRGWIGGEGNKIDDAEACVG